MEIHAFENRQGQPKTRNLVPIVMLVAGVKVRPLALCCRSKMRILVMLIQTVVLNQE